MSKLRIIGKPIPSQNGYELVTGQGQFVSDISFPFMLYGKVLRSPIPHGRILHLDFSKARKIPGVKAVVAFQDTPGIAIGALGKMNPDWYIFAKEKVRFVGEEVAAVAAVDEDTALEAIDQIQVEYEELPSVFDPREAVKPGAPIINEDYPDNIAAHFHIERGDVERGFQEADYIYEEVFQTSQAYQAYLEPVACVVKPESGGLTMWSCSQMPHRARIEYGKALDIPVGKLRIIKPHVGGGFGGKFERNLEIICAFLAMKSNRPVKMVKTREEDFISSHPRSPMWINLKIGVKKDGALTAKEALIYAPNGGRTMLAPTTTAVACHRTDSLYRFPNVSAHGYTVYTNTIPNGAFRGFGNPEMLFALESALHDIGKELHIDPIELRLKNAIRQGDVSIHGWKINSCGLTESLEKASTIVSQLKETRGKEPFYGIGVASCNHVSGNRSSYGPYDGASAKIQLGVDGSIQLFHGEADIGQGQNTVFAQIVAEILTVNMEDIHVHMVDTLVSPFGLGSFATRGTTVGGMGVKMAAEDGKKKILELAASMFETSLDNIFLLDGRVYQRDNKEKFLSLDVIAREYNKRKGGAFLTGVGNYLTKTVLPDATKYGNISPAYPFGTHVAFVKVDSETGLVTLLEYWGIHDSGTILNPLSFRGQVEGGIVMGLGWALTEEMLVEKGVLMNPNFKEYRLPGSLDIPLIHTHTIETCEIDGPFGAKGIGEPSYDPVAGAIVNAITDAIGVRIRELPVTPEKILRALKKI